MLLKKSLLLLCSIFILNGFLIAEEPVSVPTVSKDAEAKDIDLDSRKDLSKVKNSPSHFVVTIVKPYFFSNERLKIAVSADKMSIPLAGKQVEFTSNNPSGMFYYSEQKTENGVESLLETKVPEGVLKTDKEGNLFIEYATSGLDKEIVFTHRYLDSKTGYAQHVIQETVMFFNTPLFYVLTTLFALMMIAYVVLSFVPSMAKGFPYSLVLNNYYQYVFQKATLPTQYVMFYLLGMLGLYGLGFFYMGSVSDLVYMMVIFSLYVLERRLPKPYDEVAWVSMMHVFFALMTNLYLHHYHWILGKIPAYAIVLLMTLAPSPIYIIAVFAVMLHYNLISLSFYSISIPLMLLAYVYLHFEKQHSTTRNLTKKLYHNGRSHSIALYSKLRSKLK